MHAKSFVTICLITTPFCFWCGSSRGEETAGPRSRVELDAAFNDKLNVLADESAASQPDLAMAIRKLRIVQDPSRLYFFLPESKSELATLAAKSHNKEIATRLNTLQKFYAKHLFKIAQARLDEGNHSDAYRLLNEVCFHDPQHVTASRVCDATSAKRSVSARPGRSIHSEFGWKPGEYSRLKSGNYFVTTNATKESATKLVSQLEILNRVWRQLFVTYWTTGEQIESAWNRKIRLSKNRGRHEVVLFATRQGYIRFMEQFEPRARMTLGYYSIERETAYFFLNDESDDDFVSTWIHEATHQLFHESKRLNRKLSFASDFWIIEGLALYMESLQKLGACYSTGGIESSRLQFARYRRLIDSYYVPTERLIRLGRDDLQRHTEIRKLYSQSAGLTHFLIHGQSGKYRSALLSYVNQVYAGRASARTLPLLLGLSNAEIDGQYGDFLKVNDQQLLKLDPRAKIENLALGNTSVTDKSVAQLSLRHVRWLDLTNTKVTDLGLARLDTAESLRQLALQGTGATSKSIHRLSASHLLEELNIANTAVDDEALSTLEALPKLNLVLFEGSRLSRKAIKASRFVD